MATLRYWDAGSNTWQTLAGFPLALPPAGAQGAVLMKNSAADYDMLWAGTSGTVVSEKLYSVTGNWGGAASTTFIPISGTPGAQPMTKVFAGTRLRCQFGGSGWISALGYAVQIGLSPTSNAADCQQIGSFYFNEANSHRAYTGCADIAGRAAGSYSLSWYLRVTGSTHNTDANDLFWGKVSEVWP